MSHDELAAKILEQVKGYASTCGVSVVLRPAVTGKKAIMFEIIGYSEINDWNEREESKKLGMKYITCSFGYVVDEYNFKDENFEDDEGFRARFRNMSDDERLKEIIRNRWIQAMMAMWECVQDATGNTKHNELQLTMGDDHDTGTTQD